MANRQNLKPWKPGQSGNPAGKPKGTKHLSTYIQELMTDDDKIVRISNNSNGIEDFEGVPISGIVYVMMTKALQGDMGAANWLAKYGWGKSQDELNQPEKIIVVTRRQGHAEQGQPTATT